MTQDSRASDHRLLDEARAGRLSKNSDAALDALAIRAAGDRDAMTLLVAVLFEARFAKAVIHRYVVLDLDAAEDILQETMLDLPGLVERYDGSSPFRSYFSGAAANQAKRHLRLVVRDRSELAAEPVANSASSWVASRSDFEAAIKQLPRPLRDVLWLREIEGLSYDEIADRLNIPINTVRTRLNRGRRLVATSMALSLQGR